MESLIGLKSSEVGFKQIWDKVKYHNQVLIIYLNLIHLNYLL